MSMSDERRKKLEELDNFVADSRKKLFSIVSDLGWSIESISENVGEMVTCPFNESHRVPEKSLVRHLEDCQWKAEGYGDKDLPFSAPSLPPGTSMAIKFDEQLQDEVIHGAKQKNPAMTIVETGASGRLVPRTSDRLVVDFTRDERLAMYEYVIANTAQPDIGEDITDMNKPKSSGDGKTSSYLELLAQERNLKRRRAKYRGVHTNKKSQVEILREVINQQMEMLTDYISEKNDEPANECGDLTRGREADRREKSGGSDYAAKSDRFAAERSNSRSADRNGNEFQARFSVRPEDSGFHRGTFNDRGFNRGNNGFHDSHEKNVFPRERKKHSNERDDRERGRRDSDDRTSRTSSHKSHRHRSKDRNEERRKRHRSRDREESRSSRDSRHSERRSESSRRSKHDDRKSKKRRSRDR